MALKELRAHWEKGYTVLQKVVHPGGEVLVVLQDEDTWDFVIHRYFKGDAWNISIDHKIKEDITALTTVMSIISDYFSDVMPKT